MPLVRFVKSVVWAGVGRGIGEEAEVPHEREVYWLCASGDAVRVDGKEMVAGPQTTDQQIHTRDPVAEHRDPVIQPAKRSRT